MMIIIYMYMYMHIYIYIYIYIYSIIVIFPPLAMRTGVSRKRNPRSDVCRDILYSTATLQDSCRGVPDDCAATSQLPSVLLKWFRC